MSAGKLAAAPSTEQIGKAAECLVHGRVRICYADRDTVDATVRGSAGLPYRVMGSASLWACDCPANRLGSRRCYHILAVQAVWAPAVHDA